MGEWSIILLTATSPCEVVYSKEAWMKTCSLVINRNLEVGWHGVVRRSEKDPTKFVVEDILVFPQRVTSASTEPDDEDYMNWQDSLDAETFNKVRLYGHSHVNMSVDPSSTDMKVTFRRRFTMFGRASCMKAIR